MYSNNKLGEDILGSGIQFNDPRPVILVSNTPTFDSQLANKSYVDAQISGENYWDRASTTLTTHNVGDNVDLVGYLKTDTINEHTTSNGTNINGTTFKSSSINTTVNSYTIDIKHANDSIFNILNSTTNKRCDLHVDGAIIAHDNGLSSPYQLSVQSDTGDSWLEILNSAGINKGVFFGITGTGITGDAFELWNYQGGPINFYTDTSPTSGVLRMKIPNNKIGIQTNYIDELTSTNGVYIDSVFCKDGRVQNSSNSAPTDEKELTNKKYVDDTIGSGSIVSQTFSNDYFLYGCKLEALSSAGISITAGKYYNGVSATSITAFSSLSTNFSVYYMSSYLWTSTAQQQFSTPVSYISYYNPDGGVGGQLISLSAGYYCFIDVYISSAGACGVVMQNNQYSTISSMWSVAPRSRPGALTSYYYVGRIPYLQLNPTNFGTPRPISDGNYCNDRIYEPFIKKSLTCELKSGVDLVIPGYSRTLINGPSDTNTSNELLKLKVAVAIPAIGIQYPNVSYNGLCFYTQGSETADIAFGATISSAGSWIHQHTTSWLMESTATALQIYGATGTIGSAVSFTQYFGFGTSPSPVFQSLPIYNFGVSASVKAVYVDQYGQVGYNTSIRASKFELTSPTWDFLYSLRPMTFRAKKRNTDGTFDNDINNAYEDIEYGFIAEEVEPLDSNLCYYDNIEKDKTKSPIWKLTGVKYEKFIIPAIKKIQEQKIEIESLKTRLTQLETDFNNFMDVYNSHKHSTSGIQSGTPLPF